MSKEKVYTCKYCDDHLIARTADRKRGWARFCDKSCAASFKSHGRMRGKNSFAHNRKIFRYSKEEIFRIEKP